MTAAIFLKRSRQERVQSQPHSGKSFLKTVLEFVSDSVKHHLPQPQSVGWGKCDFIFRRPFVEDNDVVPEFGSRDRKVPERRRTRGRCREARCSGKSRMLPEFPPRRFLQVHLNQDASVKCPALTFHPRRTKYFGNRVAIFGKFFMKTTFYGHACFAVQIKNRTLLFDPFITPNELAKSIDVNQVPADYILITHGHSDHLADAVTIAKRTGAPIIAPFEVARWCEKQGAPKIHPVNHGGAAKLDVCTARLVNAIHSSSLPDGAYGGNPGGFLVESGEGNFYYAGDTALTMDMKLIGEFTKLKFA